MSGNGIIQHSSKGSINGYGSRTQSRLPPRKNPHSHPIINTGRRTHPQHSQTTAIAGSSRDQAEGKPITARKVVPEPIHSASNITNPSTARSNTDEHQSNPTTNKSESGTNRWLERLKEEFYPAHPATNNSKHVYVIKQNPSSFKNVKIVKSPEAKSSKPAPTYVNTYVPVNISHGTISQSTEWSDKVKSEINDASHKKPIQFRQQICAFIDVALNIQQDQQKLKDLIDKTNNGDGRVITFLLELACTTIEHPVRNNIKALKNLVQHLGGCPRIAPVARMAEN